MLFLSMSGSIVVAQSYPPYVLLGVVIGQTRESLQSFLTDDGPLQLGESTNDRQTWSGIVGIDATLVYRFERQLPDGPMVLSFIELGASFSEFPTLAGVPLGSPVDELRRVHGPPELERQVERGVGLVSNIQPMTEFVYGDDGASFFVDQGGYVRALQVRAPAPDIFSGGANPLPTIAEYGDELQVFEYVYLFSPRVRVVRGGQTLTVDGPFALVMTDRDHPLRQALLGAEPSLLTAIREQRFEPFQPFERVQRANGTPVLRNEGHRRSPIRAIEFVVINGNVLVDLVEFRD